MTRRPSSRSTPARRSALPKQVFRGFVSQLRMNPSTLQSVVTYDAIVDVQNPNVERFSSMTEHVTIHVSAKENLVKPTNAAPRFTRLSSPHFPGRPAQRPPATHPG